MRKSKAIPIAVLASIAVTYGAATPRPSYAILGTIRSLVSRYLPIAEEYLNAYLEPLLGDYSDIVGGIVSDSFESVVSGRGLNVERVLGGAIPDAAQQASDDTGIPSGIFSQAGQAVLSKDKRRIAEAGVSYLRYKYGQKPADHPNGNAGGIPGGTPKGGGVIGGGGSSGSPTGPAPQGGGGSGSSTIETSVPGVYTSNKKIEAGPGGTTACNFTTTCSGSLPQQFSKIFEDATGERGIVNPLEVRGKVTELASQGITADAFSVNPFASSNHLSNSIDRELTRASTQKYLSAEAQIARKESQQATADLLESKRNLVKDGLKSKSSQNVLKAILSTGSIDQELQSAQLELMRDAAEDNQYVKTNLANISEQADWNRRARDTELASQSYFSLHTAFGQSLPGAPKNTPNIFK